MKLMGLRVRHMFQAVNLVSWLSASLLLVCWIGLTGSFVVVFMSMCLLQDNHVRGKGRLNEVT